MGGVPMRTWLLCWDDVPEAVIVAKDDEEAERLVYKHHLKDVERGTVRHWSWRELPSIEGLDA